MINSRMPQKHLSSTQEFIIKDFKSHPYRFCLEASGMLMNFVACIIMAMLSPTPPMATVYVFFLIASILLLTSALSRRSTGFTVMYIGFLIIDSVGLYNSVW